MKTHKKVHLSNTSLRGNATLGMHIALCGADSQVWCCVAVL